MILVIDNYDSFTYNLVQYIGELGENVKAVRNDKITLKEIKKVNPSKIVISPGPGRPEKAGISCKVIKQFSSDVPILGVCLGLQCIAYSLGGKIIHAKKLMHGKISLVYHDKKNLFEGIKNPFEATRYHSLIADKESLPDILEITAHTKDDEIMALQHREHPLYGVQFHPESILTKQGKKLISNFLKM